ncbi:MAG TPA: xanthine dehydrogenase family protein subunit M [Halieaceae bacterium]|nr:MAG: xanthine dehydrogenase family protein subunit M [Gammaproteobacteria bacterium]HDY83781.1 xanthine dehydrogenase family protein subunit M [Halieaceae bacterium]
MGSVQYYAPQSLEEAVPLLKEAREIPSRILAGGTDLLVQMRAGVRTPERLIDIKKIPETTGFEIGVDEIRLGAAVPSAVIDESPELHQQLPGVVEGMELIGSTQVQGRATPGGNLCNSSPAGDGVPAMISAGGQCVIFGANGSRTIPVEEVCTAPGLTSLAEDEFIQEFRFPAPKPGQADAYLRFTPRNEMDIAVVGVAANITLDASGTCIAAKIVLGAIAPTTVIATEVAELLVGTKLDEATLAKAGEVASGLGKPISDKRGTAEFRHRIAGVLTRRVIKIAATRAGERL